MADEFGHHNGGQGCLTPDRVQWTTSGMCDQLCSPWVLKTGFKILSTLLCKHGVARSTTVGYCKRRYFRAEFFLRIKPYGAYLRV